MEHTGSTAVEKPLRPVVAKNAEILDGVGIDSAPALKGYVRFISKPTADTILKSRSEKIRCWFAGNMAWDARWYSPPTPRAAGPPIG